jgi:hypothetical protein
MKVAFKRFGKLLLGLTISFAAGAETQAREHDLCVRKFAGIELSDDAVDQVLTRSTKIVQDAAQLSGACNNVIIRRIETISSWTTELPRAVGQKSDFVKLTATPCVKVVQRISWCGGLSIVGGALGCSPIPGSSMVVVRAFGGLDETVFAGTEPVTWLHELGHLLGLQHNVSDPKNVMTPGISPDTIKLNSSDCQRFAAEPGGALIVAAAATPTKGGKKRSLAAVPRILPADGLPHWVANARAETAGPVPVEDFVKQRFSATNIPKAAAYKNDTRKLESFLSDPAYANYRSNIVGILSVVGTPDTIPILEKFLQTPITDGPAGPDTLARFAALTTIGTIANRYKLRDDAVRVLKSAQNPKFWDPILQPDGTAGSKLDDGDVQSLTKDLSVQAVHAYALTGTQAAQKYLKDMKVDLNNAAVPAEVRQERKDVLDQALKLNNISSTKGALKAFEH